MTDKSPPSGFEPHFRQSLFTDPWEPLYSKVEPRHVSIGTWLRDVHCNSRGLVHGGFVSTIADNAMGLTCVAGLRDDGREVKGLVTITLNVDFAIDEIVPLSDQWAFARTHSLGTVTINATGESAPEGNNELFLFHRDADGTWKIARYIFSTTNPPRP